MNYVFDTSCFRVMDGYYREPFSTFWEKLNNQVAEGNVFSVNQVFQELQSQNIRSHVQEWLEENKTAFKLPLAEESLVVAEIFVVPKFQESLKLKKRLTKGPFADPWVIAAGKIHKACVVTEETKSPNSAKIPNICEHFGVKCVNLETFMRIHKWSFR